MAELQLAVRYRPTRLKRLFSFIDLIRWCWLVVLPCVFFAGAGLYLIVNGLQLVIDENLWNAVALVFVYFAVLHISAVLTRPLKDFYVKVSKDGMILPWLISLRYLTRTNLIWQEVTESTIIGVAGSERLVFALDSGRRVAFDVSGFHKEELEQLLLGTELWSTHTRRTAELIDYQAQLQNEMRGIERQSYTQMWEDELSRRFRSTTFLPLDPEHKLQGGRLTVVRQLAFGGLSAIYLVQRDQQDLYVLKEAVVPGNADPAIRREAEKHLSRESQLLCTLSHQSIAKVFDYFVEDTRTYLLLEYINGQDLRQFVRQHGPQRADKVTAWAIEIAEALMYLHSRQPPIIHRDLTPDNIVLDNKGSLMIIDFGAANEFLGTATGTLIGKQAYIAPEQLRGKAVCQSDLYALGATLFFLLTGRDPIPLTSSSPQTVVPEIPAVLDTLVCELTAMETVNRIADAEKLLMRLTDVSLTINH